MFNVLIGMEEKVTWNIFCLECRPQNLQKIQQVLFSAWRISNDSSQIQFARVSKSLRLSSSMLFCLCLLPKITTMGRPFLSRPCINNLLWASSFGISDAPMEPLGTNVCLQLRYFRNRLEAFSMSRSRARRNLLIMKLSTS